MAAYVKTLLDKDDNQILPNTSVGAVSGLQSRLDSIDIGFGNKIDLTINSSTLKIDLINNSNIISTKTVNLPSVAGGTISGASYDTSTDELVLTFDTTPDATTVRIPAGDLTGALVRTVNSQTPDTNGNIAVSATNVPYSNSGTDITGTTVQAAVTELSAQKARQTVLGTEWVAGTTYNVDDHVMYNGIMYKCNTANSDATFTIANWTVVDFAKETNDKIDSLSSAIENLETIPRSVKMAMDTLFSKAAYVDDDAASSYATFRAWATTSSVTSITAVFDQGSAIIYRTDGLDTLKQYLTVTANYSDGTSGTVTDYTLSGTLTAVTSTIIVTYYGKTSTFDVIVTEPIIYERTAPFVIASSNTYYTDQVDGYHYIKNTNNQRITYPLFDLLLEGGKTYRVIAESTEPNAEIAVQAFNQNALDKVELNQNFSSNDQYLGISWGALDRTFMLPETQNNSPIVGARFTFRKDSNNSVISSVFITKLTIMEE